MWTIKYLVVLLFIAGYAAAQDLDGMPAIPDGSERSSFDMDVENANPDQLPDAQASDDNTGEDAEEPDYFGTSTNETDTGFVAVGGQGGDEENSSANDTQAFIINGYKAGRGYYKYMVSIQVYYAGIWYHVCGGALVGSKKVLTAAHCMRYYGYLKYRCGLGWHDLSRDEYSNKVQNIEVKKAVIHRGYRYGDYKNDIAVLIMKKCARFTDYVEPIKIAPPYLYLSYYYYCVFTGWGYVNKGNPYILRSMYTKVISRDTCQRLWSVNPYVRIFRKNICEVNWYDHTSACGSDSGGPLVCRGYLVGLFSYGEYYCRGCLPGVYTKVGEYSRFIKNIH